MKTFLLFVTLLFCVHQITADDEDETTLEDKCAKYIDKLISDTFENQKDKLDPLKLPENKLAFEFGMLFFKTTAEAKLHDGKLEGLSEGKRDGDVTITGEDEDVDICEATIEFENLWLKYKATVSYKTILKLFNLTVSVTGKPITSRVVVEVGLPKDGGKAEIRSVEIDGKLGMKITTTKNKSMVDLMIKPFKDTVMEHCLPTFNKVLKVDLKEALQEEADKIEYPV